MRLQLRIPRFFASTVESGTERSEPVLDGRDVVVPNRWQLPPYSVAIVGRPAVWTALDLRLPALPGIGSKRIRWEQDFGGHLFLALTDGDPSVVTLVEGGPIERDGSGNLVPFHYPEDDFAERGVVDFDPIVIAPPNGLTPTFFVQLIRETQRAYDGDQRYLAIEIPFFRVGRDSNSYAIGVLLCCGVDPRSIPKPKKSIRSEWTGYPGAEDPVHRENFGMYLGAPAPLAGSAFEVAYHNADGSVRLVVVGGEPNGTARLPDGSDVALDRYGRVAFSPEDARRRGLPSRHTDPPAQIVNRRRFPHDPAPQGAQITLVVGDRAVPLEPGSAYRGVIDARNDALGLAMLRTADGARVTLPLTELGVELRDPRRVDALMRVGNELTVGLHSDRHPKLVAHGDVGFTDRFRSHRFHAPRPVNIAGSAALGAAFVLAGAGYYFWRRAER